MMNERWPALMKAKTAASYLDMTAERFKSTVDSEFSEFPRPVQIISDGHRWRKADLDDWIASRFPTSAAGAV